MRPLLVWLHRWAGLVLALFLLLTALTGSLLAWEDELDRLLAPALHVAASGAAPAMEPLALRTAVEAQLAPAARVDQVPLHAVPGRTLRFGASPAADAPLGYDEVYVDPATGRIQGRRDTQAIGLDGASLMPMLFRLHTSLLLPSPWGELTLGIVALVWTVDCFVGAWLTLPRGRPWWQRWRPAWGLKRGAGQTRRTLDLHRAGGLWTWALLFVFAWSSVMFLLREPVYQPLMGCCLRFDDSYRALPPRAGPPAMPTLDWPAALVAARERMAAFGVEHGFVPDWEDSLSLDRRRGVYAYWVHSRLDLRGDAGNTAILIDADSGALVGHWLPTGGAAGNTVSNWLGALHMAQVFGPSYRAAVSLLGLVVAALAITGVMVWLAKRRGRRAAATRGGARRSP